MVEYEVWLKSSETAPTKAKKWISHPLGSQISCHAWKTSVEFCIAICDTCWILCAVQRPFHLFWRRSAFVGSQILWAGLVGSDDFVGANQKCVVFNGDHDGTPSWHCTDQVMCIKYCYRYTHYIIYYSSTLENEFTVQKHVNVRRLGDVSSFLSKFWRLQAPTLVVVINAVKFEL